jgi:hypothetical protein
MKVVILYCIMIFICCGCIIGFDEASEICKRKGFTPDTTEFNTCGEKEANLEHSKFLFREELIKSQCKEAYSSYVIEYHLCIAAKTKSKTKKFLHDGISKCFVPAITKCLSIVSEKVNFLREKIPDHPERIQEFAKEFEKNCRTWSGKLFGDSEGLDQVSQCLSQVQSNYLDLVMIEHNREMAKERRERRAREALDKAFAPSTTKDPFISSPDVDGCRSDFDCDFGSACVKRQFSATGFCAVKVNSNGNKTFEGPSLKSIGVEMDATCNFKHHCPIGFECIDNHCIKK